MCSRAAKAVSVPTPIYYADITCTRAGRYLAQVPTGSQIAMSDSAKLTVARREKMCADLQARIKVHDALKDSMSYMEVLSFSKQELGGQTAQERDEWMKAKVKR